MQLENLIYSTGGFALPGPDKELLKQLAKKTTSEFIAAHKKTGSFLHGAANFRADRDNEFTCVYAATGSGAYNTWFN